MLGGGGVALFQLVYSLWNQASPPVITWLILLVCLFAAAFLAWRDQHRKTKKLQSEIDRNNDAILKRRGEQAKLVWDKASELLKRPSSLMPFQALYVAGAPDLETNAQLVEVAGKISEHHHHPLQWMGKYVPQEEWLSFLQWGKRHPDFNFEKGDHYFKGLVQWAVRHNRGTEESIAAEIIRGLADHGSNAITSHELA